MNRYKNKPKGIFFSGTKKDAAEKIVSSLDKVCAGSGLR